MPLPPATQPPASGNAEVSRSAAETPLHHPHHESETSSGPTANAPRSAPRVAGPQRCPGSIPGLHAHLGDKEVACGGGTRRPEPEDRPGRAAAGLGPSGARRGRLPAPPLLVAGGRGGGGCHWHVPPRSAGSAPDRIPGATRLLHYLRPALASADATSLFLGSAARSTGLPAALGEEAPASRSSPGLESGAPSSGARGPGRTGPPLDPSNSLTPYPDSPFWALWTGPNRKRKDALPVAL